MNLNHHKIVLSITIANLTTNRSSDLLLNSSDQSTYINIQDEISGKLGCYWCYIKFQYYYYRQVSLVNKNNISCWLPQ